MLTQLPSAAPTLISAGGGDQYIQKNVNDNGCGELAEEGEGDSCIERESENEHENRSWS